MKRKTKPQYFKVLQHYITTDLCNLSSEKSTNHKITNSRLVASYESTNNAKKERKFENYDYLHKS